MRGIRSEHNIQRLDLPPTRITPTSKTSIDCLYKYPAYGPQCGSNEHQNIGPYWPVLYY